MMKKKYHFLGQTAEIDILADRRQAQKEAEKGLITPIGYWRYLKSSWNLMDAEDKKTELAIMDEAR